MRLPTIETQRLIIRQFVPEDWPSVFAYSGDPAVMQYMGEGVHTEEQARTFVAESSGADARACAIVRRDTAELIGHLVFHDWYAPRTAEIGWVLHPAHQRRGYVTEAAHALLAYAFETLALHRVIATCQPENPASFMVMEKLGMRREGWFRKCIHRGGDTWWDELFYAILAEEWNAGSHNR
jgi:RimJ/RimL family protein N-acetyltransferase